MFIRRDYINTGESGGAFTSIVVDEVNAGGVIETWRLVRTTLVNVHLTLATCHNTTLHSLHAPRHPSTQLNSISILTSFYNAHAGSRRGGQCGRYVRNNVA